MAKTPLNVLVRIKHNKHYRMQCLASNTVLELLKKIAADLHISVDQLQHVAIYRNSPTSEYKLLGGYGGRYDVTLPLEKYGVMSNEEFYIDLSGILSYQEYVQEHDQEASSSSYTSSFSPYTHGPPTSKSKVSSSSKSHAKATISSPSSSSSSVVPSFSNTKKQEQNNSEQQQYQSVSGGQLIRYPVPADNSCLFTSIYFVLHSGKMDLSANKCLRDVVATKIESDQTTYTEAVLGRTNADYCKWIRKDDSWGGGIELAILTHFFETEICVINTESGGRIDYFGEDCHFPYRVFLLYNNVHYDPVYHTKYDVAEEKELIQTKFLRTDEEVLSLAKDMIDELIEDASLIPSSSSTSSTLDQPQQPQPKEQQATEKDEQSAPTLMQITL